MTRLDDLLGYEETPRRSGSDRGTVIKLVALLVGCVAVSWLITWVLRVYGVGVPFQFVLGTLLCLGALRGILVVLGPPSLPDTLKDAPWRPPAHPNSDDGVARAVSRWETRLEFGKQDADRFARVSRPAIIDIIDERLRLRHGVSRAHDPRRAEALLGPYLWAFVHQPVTRTLKPQEIATLVAQMEAL